MKGYTIAHKKHQMASRMPQGLTMHGKQGSATGGMKYDENGTGSTHGGGESYRQAGKGMEHTRGMRDDMSNKKGKFSSNKIYTQHGK